MSKLRKSQCMKHREGLGCIQLSGQKAILQNKRMLVSDNNAVEKLRGVVRCDPWDGMGFLCSGGDNLWGGRPGGPSGGCDGGGAAVAGRVR